MDRRCSAGVPAGRGARSATVLSTGTSFDSTSPRNDIAIVRNGVHASSLEGCGYERAHV